MIRWMLAVALIAAALLMPLQAAAQDEDFEELVAEARAHEGSIQVFIEQTEAAGGDPILEVAMRELKRLEGEIAVSESLESLNAAGRSIAHSMSIAALRFEELYPTEVMNDAVEAAGGWDAVAAIAVTEGYDLVAAQLVRQGYPASSVPESLRLLNMNEARAAAYTLRDIGVSGLIGDFGGVILRACDDDPEQECQQRKRNCDDRCRNARRLTTIAVGAAAIACAAARGSPLPPTHPAKIALVAACRLATVAVGAARAREESICRQCRSIVCP